MPIVFQENSIFGLLSNVLGPVNNREPQVRFHRHDDLLHAQLEFLKGRKLVLLEEG